MDPSDATSSAAASRASRGEHTRSLVGAALDRALAGVTLYEPDHPARRGALRACVEAIRASADGVISLRVGPAGWEDASQADAKAMGGELARTLCALDIVAIELSSSLDEARLSELLSMIAHARAEGCRGSALETRAKSITGAGAVLHPIRTGALTMVESGNVGTARGNGACGSASSWSDFVDAMLNPGVGGDASEGGLERRLASLVGGGSPPASLGPDLARLGSRLGELSEEEHQAASSRLANWLGGLPAETRDSLLSMSTPQSEGTSHLLHALAGRLPLEQILGALERRPGGEGSLHARHNLMLFSKLSTLAMDSSVDLQKRVLGAMQRLGGASAAAPLRAVEQLLQPNRADDYTPQEYRERLLTLSKSMTQAAMCLKDASELGDEALLVRVGEIAAYLIEHDTSRPPGLGVFTHLARAIPADLARGSLTTIQVAARTSAGWSKADQDVGHEVRDAARALGERVFAHDHMLGALAIAGRNASRRESVLTLLEAAGRAGVEAVMACLAGVRHATDSHAGAWTSALEAWLSSRAFPSGVEGLAQHAKDGTLSLRALLGMVRAMPREARESLLQDACAWKDPVVRRCAYALLDEIEPRWTGPQIRRAILDEDAEVAARGEAHLSRDASEAELCSMLRSLTLSVSADEARLARAVAHVLELRPKSEDILSAIKAWRFSPARVRAGLLSRRVTPAPKEAA